MADAPRPMKKGYKALLDEANAVVDAIAPTEAASRADDGGTVLVDLRDIRELQRDGRVPGAFHCPRGMLEFWIDPESPYHRQVFASGKNFAFFCGSGWRSALAAKAAQEMGLEGVSHMAGGFKAWKEADLPVEQGPPKT